MTVLGEAAIEAFAKKHAQSRRPLGRFLVIVRAATWRTFQDVKETFAATDYVNGIYIFDIGGNKYRLLAAIEFEMQEFIIESVLTHEQYDREEL